MDEPWGPSSYGDRAAEFYDEETRVGPGPAVAFLAPLAAGGRALELGVGTGRVALALAACGVEVHGIDASAAMVARLRSKPGGRELPVTIGDFADVAVDGTFDLIFVAVSTLFALVTQDDQVRCFANVAAHLTDHGAFVVDAFVPDPRLVADGRGVGAHRVEADEVAIIATHDDPAARRLRSVELRLRHAGVRLSPMEIRPAWPSELDLMARHAGLRLRDRFGGWGREPFTARSGVHVSVYARPGNRNA